MGLQSINPATGELIRAYDEIDQAELHRMIESCVHSQIEWASTSFSERSRLMKTVAGLLRERRDAHARIITMEMGKPVSQSRAEIEKCAWVCDYYAENAALFLADETVDTDAAHSFVAAEPLGVVLAIMPWNFPYWQAFRFVAPALMAGNGALLKHAGNVFGCALGIEEVFREAGFPENLFRSVAVGSRGVDAVIRHEGVRAVTLTGSVGAGRAVAEKAGAALKKTVLELGGSDPYLVLEDADVESAARICVASRLINTGQSCIAAKRFILVESVREKFTEVFLDEMKGKQLGDPMDPEMDLGPLAREDLRDELHRQVERSVEAGARRLLGGEIPDRPGYYYLPTVLENVRPGSPAFDEETFGPVAALISASGEEEAVALANHSSFGLGAAVFTSDRRRGERVARRLEAGNCFVNNLVKSDPRLPFGGIKESGYGRELGAWGIREFVNFKTVYID